MLLNQIRDLRSWRADPKPGRSVAQSMRLAWRDNFLSCLSITLREKLNIGRLVLLNSDYIGTIKKFGEFYKLTVTRPVDSIKKDYISFNKEYDLEKEIEKLEKEQERFENNISRAKNTILELALCNYWQYFVTFTINKKKFDREDLSGYYKKFSQYIRDYRKCTGCKIKYMIVPELHKDGKSYHLHGLMADMASWDIVPHTNRRNAKKGYLEFMPYTQKFGFNTLSCIENPLACSLYMQKYITKDLGKVNLEKGQKLFYASQKLQRAVLVQQARITRPITSLNFDFQNDYVSSVFADNLEVLETYF